MAVHQLHFSIPKLQLGYLSAHNPFDRRAFSGTSFFAAQALENRPDVQLRVLGNHRAPRLFDRIRAPAPLDVDHIQIDGLDAVIGLAATPLLNQLIDRHPELPVIHVTDATPAFLRDVYGWSVPAQADEAETCLARRAAKVVYSSQAIAARAAVDLSIQNLQPAAIPFGVNFEHLLSDCAPKPSLARLNLLFVGLDWERKGGDVAVAALDELWAQGHDVQLTVVGRCPERHKNHPAIVYAGFLDKNRPKDAAKLSALYAQTHLLLLPSRADCTPMVVAEAMAHGTPVIATDVGGVREQIGGAGAGRILPAFASPQDWAEMILQCAEVENYAFLAEASFDRAQNALSWSSWAHQIENLARETVDMPAIAQRDFKVAVGK